MKKNIFFRIIQIESISTGEVINIGIIAQNGNEFTIEVLDLDSVHVFFPIFDIDHVKSCIKKENIFRKNLDSSGKINISKTVFLSSRKISYIDMDKYEEAFDNIFEQYLSVYAIFEKSKKEYEKGLKKSEN